MKMHIRKLLATLLVLTFMCWNTVEAGELKLTTVEYTVVAGETLDNIAKLFVPSEWGSSHRAFAVFKEGIYEYNYDKVFINRDPYEVKAGDMLMIVFWQQSPD